MKSVFASQYPESLIKRYYLFLPLLNQFHCYSELRLNTSSINAFHVDMDAILFFIKFPHLIFRRSKDEILLYIKLAAIS